MSTLALKTSEYGTTWINVNGRNFWIANRITEIENTGRNQWRGVANGCEFTIEGGRVRGGTSRDWFVDCYGMTGLTATSIKDAVKLLETC